MSGKPQTLELPEAVYRACSLEVSSVKAGNVYPGRDFPDLGVADFLAAATACATVFQQIDELGVGQLVLESVRRGRSETRSNANLGIVLLLAPLGKASSLIGASGSLTELRSQLAAVLAQLTPSDGRHVFQAIREAAPGGLGSSDKHDVLATQGDVDLIAAMRTGQDRDTIALQYSTNFRYLFDTVVPCLREAIEDQQDVSRGISQAQIQLLSQRVDTLIVRKCGDAIASEAMQRARVVADAGDFDVHSNGWIDLDRWFRGDKNRRNPGTTADLIAAGLFVLLRTDLA